MIEVISPVITLLAASLLLTLGFGFGPFPTNLLTGMELLGIPIWFECLSLGSCLTVVGGLALWRLRAGSAQSAV